jgi:glycosyltransferase involved in cell wall biosynthesis
MKPFSVIVPTSGRRDALGKALDSIQAQSAELIQEIIVVFDCERVDREIALRHADVRFLATGGNKGPAFARNIGARKAQADYLLFLDDDILIEEGALSNLAKCVRMADRPTAVAAQIVPDASVPLTPYVRFAYSDVAHSRFSLRSTDIDCWNYCSSFAAAPRAAFLSVGGFNEVFRRYEEVELAVRLQAAGVGLRSCPEAIGRHLKILDRAWFIERGEVVGGYLRMLLGLHPETKRSMRRALEWLGFTGPVLRFVWVLCVKCLPLVERLPAAVAVYWLRMSHAVGLAGSYLDSRHRPGTPDVRFDRSGR